MAVCWDAEEVHWLALARGDEGDEGEAETVAGRGARETKRPDLRELVARQDPQVLLLPQRRLVAEAEDVDGEPAVRRDRQVVVHDVHLAV